MKVLPAARLLTCGSLAWLLSACGGGGSAASVPAAPVPTLAPATPTASPSPYPVADGDTFTYQGSVSQKFTRFATPAPSPTAGATPQPTSTPWYGSANDTVTQNVTLHTGASFNGATGLIEADTHETDQGDHLVTTTIDSKQYLSLAADSARSNGIDLTQLGVQTSDSSGVSTVTTFASGNGVLDELPQIPQAQWSNTAARSYAENDSSGLAINNAYNADGSYTGSVQFPEGGSSSITENPDGSGLYVFPLVGAPVPSQLTYSAADLSGNLTIGFQDNADEPAVMYALFSAWYPSIPPVLSNDTFTDYGAAALPSGCNVGSNVPKQATRIDETRTQLDTIFGELDSLTQSSYVAGPYGVVCTVVHDKLVYYYDLTGQSSFLNGFGPWPIQETDTDETLALQSATMKSSSAKHAALSAPGGYAAPVFLRSQIASAKRRIAIVKHISTLKRKTL